MTFNEVYKGRRVLITGNTGFKGSWLTLWLIKLGANVLGYSLEPPTVPSLYETLNLKNEVNQIIGDIRDFDKLLETIKQFKPEIIFHLAAQPLVRRSYKEPRLTYETNVMGTINLFEAIRFCDSVRVVVNITTDKCYENKEWVWGYRETDPMGGHDPYSSSKACSELVTSAYRRSFFEKSGVAVASARAGNVIGGGDWAEDRLIPDIVRSLSIGKEIVIRSPNAIRPWQHVLEPLYGYLLLGMKLFIEGKKYAQAWNFGPDESDTMNVESVVRKSIELWGAGSYRIENSEQLHEANMLRLDVSKAHILLGWKPRTNVKKALEMTINWYKKFYSNERELMKNYTENQLLHFTELLKR